MKRKKGVTKTILHNGNCRSFNLVLDIIDCQNVSDIHYNLTIMKTLFFSQWLCSTRSALGNYGSFRSRKIYFTKCFDVQKSWRSYCKHLLLSNNIIKLWCNTSKNHVWNMFSCQFGCTISGCIRSSLCKWKSNYSQLLNFSFRLHSARWPFHWIIDRERAFNISSACENGQRNPIQRKNEKSWNCC